MTPLERFESNEKIVYYVYQKEFPQHITAKEDLISEGRLGLWKACNSFNEERGTQFSTLAYVVVRRHMVQYLRWLNKHKLTVSLEDKLPDEEDICLIDTIGNNEDLTLGYSIIECLEKFSERDQQILKLLMCGYSQQETADMYHVSQATVSRALTKYKKLLEREIIDL